MREIDLGPGEYTERKPKGWRWRLPLAHPEDAKMQALYMVLALAALGLLFIYRNEISTETLVAACGLCGVVAGGMFALAFRDF
jgi:hypothetical protein